MADYSLLAGSNVIPYFSSVYIDWALLAGALIIISSGLAAFVYLVGALLANDKIKTWAKIEFVEVFYSLVLLALTVSFLGTMDATVQSIARSDPFSNIVCSPAFDTAPYYKGLPCHIKLGMSFLNSLFNEGTEIAYENYAIYIFTSAIAEMNLNLEVITEQAGVFAYNPIKGFFSVGNMVKMMVFDYTMKIMTITKFQEVLLRFIGLALFPTMFTVGIITRSFFFTRKLGGLLMALAISLYFIFPMFYVAGGMFFNEFKLKAVAISCTGGVAGCDHSASALKSLYVDMKGFPTLGGPLDTDELFVKGREAFVQDPHHKEYMNTPGAAKAFDALNQLGAKLDMCKQLTEAETDDYANQIVGNATNLVDQLKKKNFYNKALFLAETVDPGGYIDSVSKLTFFSLFFSFLGVMASVAAVKSLSGLFGGDLEIAGLTHLI